MPYGTLNVDKIVNDNGVTFAGLYGFKNRIINGAMVIDQRNAGASVTAIVGGNTNFAVDRFVYTQGSGNAPTLQRSTVAPAGFINSLVVTAGTASTPSYSQLAQRIEGVNMADMGFGSANAQTITLSFWVRSSVTGTFSVSFRNSAANRSYIATYAINTANTWEYKTATIPGDTSGTWLTDNGVWCYLVWDMKGSGTGTAGSWTATADTATAGSTGIMGTTGATFYITGVQLEKGSTATSFDYRPYGTELQLCQRYYQVLASGSNLSVALGGAYTATSVYMSVPLKVSMRSAPTLSATSGTNFYIFYRNGANDPFNSLALEAASTEAVELNNVSEISGTVGWAGMVRTNNASSFIAFSSEL